MVAFIRFGNAGLASNGFESVFSCTKLGMHETTAEPGMAEFLRPGQRWLQVGITFLHHSYTRFSKFIVYVPEYAMRGQTRLHFSLAMHVCAERGNLFCLIHFLYVLTWDALNVVCCVFIFWHWCNASFSTFSPCCRQWVSWCIPRVPLAACWWIIPPVRARHVRWSRPLGWRLGGGCQV